MKKFIVLAIVVLLLAGCQTLNFAAQAKQFISQGVQTVDEKICPTVETAKDAVKASNFLWPLISQNPKLYSAWLVFDNFSKGLCYANSQLKDALAGFDEAAVVVRPVVIQGQVIRQTYRGVVAPAVPDISALRKAVK